MDERRRVKIVLILSFLPVFFTKNWLGGKDSNLRYRIQSPGPYRLATAHPELLQEQFNRPGMISAHPLPRALWLPPSATTFWYSAIIFSSIIFRVSLLM